MRSRKPWFAFLLLQLCCSGCGKVEHSSRGASGGTGGLVPPLAGTASVIGGATSTGGASAAAPGGTPNGATSGGRTSTGGTASPGGAPLTSGGAAGSIVATGGATSGGSPPGAAGTTSFAGTPAAGNPAAHSGGTTGGVSSAGAPAHGGAAAGGEASTTGGAALVGPPEGFCSGDAKIWRRGEVVRTSVVAANEVPLMNCCQTVEVVLRTETNEDAVRVVVRAWQSLELGDYRLGATAEPGEVELDAYVRDNREDGLWEDQHVVGTVRVSALPSATESASLSLCLQVDDPGDPSHGVAVFTGEVIVLPPGAWGRFGLWRLADSDASLTPAEAAERSLDSLSLEVAPVVALTDIAYYDGSTHRIGWLYSYQHTNLGGRLGQLDTSGVPFVVQADGERIYLGTFVEQSAAAGPVGPVVVVSEGTEEGFTISAPLDGTEDSRSDPRILAVLADAARLLPNGN